MTKKMFFTPVSLFLIAILLSGCAGVYLGGGGAYNMAGGDAQRYSGISHEIVIFPKLDPGAGFYVELGKNMKGAMLNTAFSSTQQKGKYLNEALNTSYGSVSFGSRFIFDDFDFFIKPAIPVNLFYQWLTVAGGARKGLVIKDAVFSGFGLDIGAGAVINMGSSFALTADLLWRFNSYGSAAGGESGGKLNESYLSAGPALKAGLYFIMN